MKIEIKNLTKEFKGVEIFKDVNMFLKGGKIYGLIGRNGSGKSVFLKTITGFYYPTEGVVIYNGIDIFKENTFPKDTGALIENPNFMPDLTGFENLKSLAVIQNKISDKEILEALQIVNLIDEKDKKYHKYSLGMKQKLGIAQAIMENQKIIILDEPFNGIENHTVDKLRKYFKKQKEKGKLIIIASHIKDDIDSLADEVYQFDAGYVKKNKV